MIEATPIRIIGCAALLSGCLFKASSSDGGGQISKQKAHQPRMARHGDVDVPRGYRIDVVARRLTFPTGVAFGPNGAIYVVESGYSYGEVVSVPRILEIGPRGETVREVARGTHPPWNGIDFHDGGLFVSQGGALELAGRIVRYGLDGNERVLIDKLPTGDHHTNGPLAADGWIYFGQGTRTNSGVVGPDNYNFGWLQRAPEAHDIPCKDVTLAGVNFESGNPFTEHEEDTVITGPYLPFGKAATAGQVVRGALPCSGAVMRVRPDGSNLELVAWGLRNPFGFARGEDGIYLTENGYDVRGSRPVFGAADYLRKLEPGAWYGWPDFAGHAPLNHPAFAEASGAPKGLVLTDTPSKPPEPAAYLPVHGSANGFDIARDDTFGRRGHAFIALFGDMAPTVGKVMAPVGFKILDVDPKTGVYEVFARNHGPKNAPASLLGTHGLERPVAARFDPSGQHLYVVDFGVVRMTERGAEPQPATGVLWRISREAPDAR